MSKVQIFRLLVSVPKVSRLTACHFCVSNRMETNARHKFTSVFERYVEYQIENKVPLNYGKVLEEDEEVKNKLESSPTVEEIEQSDKTDGLAHSRSSEKKQESPIFDETVSDERYQEDQVNISENINVTQPNKNVQYEDENSKTLKSKVKRNSVSNQDISETVVNGDTTPVKCYVMSSKKANINGDQGHLKKIYIPDSNSPLWYIVNCELMPDANLALNRKDYVLFHEYLEKTQMSCLPSVTDVIFNISRKKVDIYRKRKQRQKEDLSEVDVYRKREQRQYMKTKKNVPDFRESIYRYLSGENSIEISPNLQGYWNSVIHVLDSLKKDDIQMLHNKVRSHHHHPLLHYRAEFNCIALYRNTLCVIDFKISDFPKPFLSTTQNYPLLAAANLGVVNTSLCPDLIKLGPVTNAVMVFAYSNGQPAHVHYLNDLMVDVYWNKWLEMLYWYWYK